jgi:hypothetical protein
VKFLAPSLSLPVALDVGRQTFAALNLLELGLALAVLAATMLQHRNARQLTHETAHQTSGQTQGQVIISVVLIALVLWQTLWLLPVLDSRVEIILQGDSPPASGLHLFYIGVDALKLLLLGLVAGSSLARLRHL